jgi:hypothetical protein
MYIEVYAELPYDLSRFPPLDPVLEPGLPSIVAMVGAVTARIDAGLA